MTVLVDTSVWIRFLANRPFHAAELDRLLVEGRAAGHDLIFGELLIGDRGGRGKFLDVYRKMSWIATVPHEDVASFVTARRLHGQGIGWVDAHLLASALVDNAALWTANETLARIANDLGAGYRLHEE